ncbi:MAG: hypothetical protein ACT4QD_25560 [Acidobacteriota bacterium]
MRCVLSRCRIRLLTITLFAPAALASAQEAPDYFMLDTLKTSTMQKELQDAADKGYRLVPGQGAWLLNAILEKAAGNVEPVEYLLLATSRSGTMQKEIDGASAQGYRFASVLGIGSEVIIAMQRPKAESTRSHEQVLLATTAIKTMQREMMAETAKGFRFVGQTVFQRVLGGPEFVAILERRVQK